MKKGIEVNMVVSNPVERSQQLANVFTANVEKPASVFSQDDEVMIVLENELSLHLLKENQSIGLNLPETAQTALWITVIVADIQVTLANVDQDNFTVTVPLTREPTENMQYFVMVDSDGYQWMVYQAD
ncbi:hypothetical protein D3P96_07955 [Weissella viridescens]|uniref:Uncharacterized protein n=1 Tax=Weissella viridescens TaxID=1629 RepID=A0A3P2RCA0_WEIVI|nr:hypothetical protein [Weissella viridescens]RRG17406.1 hypothetical protein D3P96_07955 [Weissella viridescens]